MSERIHAFGDNGELSNGASLAFQQFMTGTVQPLVKGRLEPVTGQVFLPTNLITGLLVGYRVLDPSATFVDADGNQIDLQPGAYVFELSPTGWQVRAVGDGTTLTVPLFSDDFETDRADIFGTLTPQGSAPWKKALSTPLAGIYEGSQMKAVGGEATHSASSGGGAHIDVPYLDMRVEVDFRLSVWDGQARVMARGTTPEYFTTDRSGMPVQAIITGMGAVKLEPWLNELDEYKQLVLAPDGTFGPTPFTGTLALEVEGAVARVYVNGSQIGSDYSLATWPKQQMGTIAGFGTYLGGYAQAFRVMPL